MRQSAVRAGTVALFVLAVHAPAAADALPERAQPVADYEITVRLDPERKQLHGEERVTWRNPSGDHVPDLWFHLYLNAFKDRRSTFFKETGGRLRRQRMVEGRGGWIEVTALRLEDGTDLTAALRFEDADGDNPDDRTVVRVPLPRPVPPGGAVTLRIAFRAQLPEVFARTGYKRDFYMVGQWFPKLGVYEPAGTRGRTAGGWNCHAFHGDSEFYADFGRYRVEMTAPSAFVVGATGQRRERRDNGDGTTTHAYQAQDVHDFAWTASPGFVEVRRRFSAASDVTPEEYAEQARRLGRSLDEVRLRDVEIVLLMQPGHLDQADRYAAAAVAALKHFGLWYGRYPYPALTVVDPAPRATGAGGMEYPTLVTAGTSFLLARGPLRRVLAPELVTVHEIGHQFWYGLVASNEFEESWLDEGFTSYATAKVLDRLHGADASVLSAFGLRLGQREMAQLRNNVHRKYDAVRTRAWEYSPGNYAFNSYARTHLTLLTLEALVGEQTMARILRTYHERWRFRHPASEDFFAVASEVAGRDLSWFFGATVLRGDQVDYHVASVTSRRAEGGYRSEALLRRRGEAALPVAVAFHFEGGRQERVTWDGRTRFRRYRFSRAERLLWVELDPEGGLALEVNGLDDARRARPDARAAGHWAARLVFWLQSALAVLGP